MKRRFGKTKKMAKGMPSAVVLSLLIHAALFLLAGMLVVFTVVKKEEKKFIPPKAVERPKMKLRKPKVTVKKTSKPKPTPRIVTRVKRANMPDIQLPEMSGMSDGLSGGMGGFESMPELGEITVFGSGQSIGNDFVGTFYDFKRDRQGRPLATMKEDFAYKLTHFVKRGWKTSLLASYYQSPRKLYATSFMVPPIKSILGPRAFGEDTGGWCWMVHYKGKLVYPEDIKFRFWGFGDDILMVRVDGELVLNGNWHDHGANTYITDIGGSWDSTSNEDARFWYGNNKARVGNWIEIKAGELHDMDVMIGEAPGGSFSAMLTIQVAGVEYERNGQGGPILPMFSTAAPARDLQDAIYKDLVRGEVAVTNGPVFRDYILPPQTNRTEKTVARSEATVAKRHVWTRIDGQKIEAEYVTLIANNVVLESSRGTQFKVPMAKLSPSDCEYIELMNPPEFAIDFVRQGSSKLNRYELSPMEIIWDLQQPRVNDYVFGAKVKQTSSGLYNHELTVEYFALGKENLGNKYILLDHQSSTFIPTQKNGRSHEFRGAPIELVEYDLDEQKRGVKPAGNLIVITDGRGQIIQYRAPNVWLWENIENLRRLPVGAYMDKTCRRVYPTPPKSTQW